MSEYYNRVRSDQQRSNVPSSRNDDDAVRRPKNEPQDPERFKKVLDDRPDDSKELAKRGIQDKDRIAKGDPALEKKEMAEDFIKKTTQPEVDPRFNQMPTLGKDTKLAPKLGSETMIAPSEEPRALAALEGLEKDKILMKKGLESTLVKEMALDKAEMMAKNSSILPPDKSELKKKPTTSLYDLILGAGKTEEKKPGDHVAYVDGSSVIASGVVTQNLEKAGLTSTQLKNLIEQITVHMKSMENQTQINTTLEIKNLAAFNGATVTVTTYSTAKGEINIAFENLTQQGKHILDLTENRSALQQALDQKGYTVHMIVTSTVERQYNDSNIAQNQKDQRGDGSSQGQFEREQQKQQKQQK